MQTSTRDHAHADLHLRMLSEVAFLVSGVATTQSHTNALSDGMLCMKLLVSTRLYLSANWNNWTLLLHFCPWVVLLRYSCRAFRGFTQTSNTGNTRSSSGFVSSTFWLVCESEGTKYISPAELCCWSSCRQGVSSQDQPSNPVCLFHVSTRASTVCGCQCCIYCDVLPFI